MQTVAQLIHVAHGSPKMPECGTIESRVRCYMCAGDVERGMPVADWMGGNFTDHTRVLCPESRAICEACVMLSSRVSPVLGRDIKEGKKFGACFRNVSNAVEIGWSGIQAPGYANYSKGEKPAILAFLEREHVGNWGIAIGDSGQKHCAFLAPLNGPGRTGTIVFEEALVNVPGSLALVYRIRHLLTAGASKDEVESGEYRSQTWMRCRETVEAFETAGEGERGTEWFGLALWLAQRDEERVAERQEREKSEAKARKLKGQQDAKRTTKKARVAAGRDGASSPQVVRGDKKRAGSSRLLGQDPGHDSGRVKDDDHTERVGEQRPARPADQGTGQRRLPGFD